MQDFYVLMIVNHATKEFNIRVEVERGDHGSVHSLQSYMVTMTEKCLRYDRGEIKTFYMKDFWERVTRHSNEVEQIVLARIAAETFEEAQTEWRTEHRKSFNHFYKGLGYRGFTHEPTPAQAIASLAVKKFDHTFGETQTM